MARQNDYLALCNVCDKECPLENASAYLICKYCEKYFHPFCSEEFYNCSDMEIKLLQKFRPPCPVCDKGICAIQQEKTAQVAKKEEAKALTPPPSPAKITPPNATPDAAKLLEALLLSPRSKYMSCDGKCLVRLRLDSKYSNGGIMRAVNHKITMASNCTCGPVGANEAKPLVKKLLSPSERHFLSVD